MAASFPPGGSGMPAVKPTSYGNAVQPQAVVTASGLATPLAATAVSAFGPRGSVTAGEVVVTPGELFQPFLGGGAAITDATASLLLSMTDANRAAFLAEAFGTYGFSTIRICLPSGGFQATTAEAVYEEDPTDLGFTKLSIAADAQRVIPIVQQILAINPRVRVFTANWSPPAWMKASSTIKGGAVNETNANAQALAKFYAAVIQAWASYGIPIAYIALQNEPTVSSGSYATCTMSAGFYTTLIKYAGAEFAAAGITTKILTGDDNWSSVVSYGSSTFADGTATSYCAGVAHHDYAGFPKDLLPLALASPTKEFHATEHRSLLTDTLAATQATMSNLFFQEMRYDWSKTYWNLALNENGLPSTSGSTGRRGVVTINSSTAAVTRNPEYYLLAHICQYVRQGARRCGSTSFGISGALQTLAYINPDSSIVLLLYNGTAGSLTVPVTDANIGMSSAITVPAGAIATMFWDGSSTVTAATIAPPSAPSVSVALNAQKNVRLSWAAPSSTLPIGGYRVLRGTASGNETLLACLPGSATSFVDKTALAGTTYFYQLVAQAGAYSVTSNEVSLAAQVFVYGSPQKPSTAAAYSYQPIAVNGNGTITWSATGLTGSGLSISSTTGAVTGSTLAAGTYNIVITATDANSNAGTQSITLVIGTTATYVTPDAQISTTGVGVASLSASLTLGAGANLILVSLCQQVIAVSPTDYPSATQVNVIDGSGNVFPMVRVSRAITTGSTTALNRMAEIWVLRFTDTLGAFPSGTVTIQASTPQGAASGLPSSILSAQSYTNAAGTPLGTAVSSATTAAGGSTSGTVTVAGVANGLIFGSVCVRSTSAPTLGTGETAVLNTVINTTVAGGGFTQANAATPPSTTATIGTADQFAICAVPVAPS